MCGGVICEPSVHVCSESDESSSSSSSSFLCLISSLPGVHDQISEKKKSVRVEKNLLEKREREVKFNYNAVR